MCWRGFGGVGRNSSSLPKAVASGRCQLLNSMGPEVGNANKTRELSYLLEDLVKDLSKFANQIYVGPFEQELIDEVNQKIELLSNIQLGQE